MLIDYENTITHIEQINGNRRVCNRPNGDNNIHQDIFKTIANEIDKQLFQMAGASTRVKTDAGSRYVVWFGGENWYAYVV